MLLSLVYFAVCRLLGALLLPSDRDDAARDVELWSSVTSGQMSVDALPISPQPPWGS
jgi:hypothetical protein